METEAGKISLVRHCGTKLGRSSLGLNLPLNFSKLNFRKDNKFMVIGIFQKLNFRSSGLEFSLGGVLTPLNSKLNLPTKTRHDRGKERDERY